MIRRPPRSPLFPYPTLSRSRAAPPTHRLLGGNWKSPRETIAPAFPVFLGTANPDLRLPQQLPSTGRRAALARWLTRPDQDRKSTRLNSSHSQISYAVFCLNI